MVPLLLVVMMGVALPAAAGPRPAPHRKRNPVVWLNSARQAIKTAGDRVASAELTHEFDAEGHAAKAKELIAQAKAELDAAVQYVKDHPNVADVH